MISCPDALARMYEFMDGELDGAVRDEVAAHFEVCARCYPHLRFEERFRRRVQEAARRPEVPEGLRSRVLDILDQGP
jgi:anti-sigma factor (TIGR02949 family)